MKSRYYDYEPCDPCDPCRKRKYPYPCPEEAKFLSCYLEAVGNTQDVGYEENIVFDYDPDFLDIVGDCIEIDSTGTIFTISRAGLYHIEWSINLESVQQPVAIGLLENGEPISAITTSAANGNLSSGALIHVQSNDVTYTITLHNFGPPIRLANPVEFENTAASIRILRFADGAIPAD